MFEKYHLNSFSRAINNPWKVSDEIIQAISPAIQPLCKFKFERNYDYSQNPLTEDWDNLMILDACRFDKLKKINPTGNKVDYKILRSSNSPEFIEKYINNKQYYDMVYISSNPYVHKIKKDTFYDIFSPYEDNTNQEKRLDKGKQWSPDLLHDKSSDIYNEIKNKKFLIHFMQPHAPYYGKKANELRKKIRDQYNVRFYAWDSDLSNEEKEDNIIPHLLSAAMRGYISSEELSKVYEENLSIVLNHCLDLAEELGGKTIITSDHGEELGDTQPFCGTRFGHGKNIYTEGLRKVPWLTLDYNNRRSTNEGSPNNVEIESNLSNQLRALGYKK